MSVRVPKLNNFAISLTLLLLFEPHAMAKEGACTPSEAPPEAEFNLTESQLSVLDRLTDFWRGQGFGGSVEEWWSPRDGDEMFGVFRGSQDGKTDFYEFMKISPWEKGYRQIVRHMNAEGAPWVYKPVDTQFRMVDIDDECIQFDGVAYWFRENGGLTVTVLVGIGSSGEHSLATGQFTRTALP